jgi:hypothetical protein
LPIILAELDLDGGFTLLYQDLSPWIDDNKPNRKKRKERKKIGIVLFCFTVPVPVVMQYAELIKVL